MNTTQTNTTTVALKSGFQRGASVREVTGTFPEFEVKILAAASENTWHDDGDSSCTFAYAPKDTRALFLVHYWGVSSLSYESHAEALTAGADALCARPLPKGWAFTIPGANLGGATGRSATYVGGKDDGWGNPVALGRYLCDLAAGRGPGLQTPAERREAFENARVGAIEGWDAAGLDGTKIWDAKIQWAREPQVIELAARLVMAGFRGHSAGKSHFRQLNGFSTPISHPRTSTAEKMAELTTGGPGAPPRKWSWSQTDKVWRVS